MTLNIVAAAAEPEFITLTDHNNGIVDLTVEIARMQVAGAAGITETTGSIQLQLLLADVEIITRRLAEIEMAKQHSVSVDAPTYEWVVEVRQGRARLHQDQGRSRRYLPAGD